MINKWIYVHDKLPSENEVVETKIDNSQGCCNVCKLKRQGWLWFFPDDSMYVYYTPTHWRPIVDEARKELI